MRSSLPLSLMFVAAAVFAQEPSPPAPNRSAVTLAQGLEAADYGSIKGAVKISFNGTALMPQASGKAKIKGEGDYLRLKAHFEGLEAATRFGPGYLTYVLWAVAPEGKAYNLGELKPDHQESWIKAPVSIRQFALAVTAEPDGAVGRPGNAVVLRNDVSKLPFAREVDAKSPLLPREEFVWTQGQNDWSGDFANPGVLLDLREARLAVHRALWAGAESYAPKALGMAQESLAAAEREYQIKIDERTRAQERYRLRQRDGKTAAAARDAIESAEDALLIALDAKDAEAAGAKASQARLAMGIEPSQENLRDALAQRMSPEVPAAPAGEGAALSLHEEFFQARAAGLQPAGKPELARLCGFLSGRPGLKVRIDGYTDDKDNAFYNQRLSYERARAVEGFFIRCGMAKEDIEAYGFGEARPIASNQTADGRWENRRVEITVSGPK